MVERGGLPKARSVLLIAERGAPQAIRSDNVLTAECGEVVRTKMSCASEFSDARAV